MSSIFGPDLRGVEGSILLAEINSWSFCGSSVHAVHKEPLMLQESPPLVLFPRLLLLLTEDDEAQEHYHSQCVGHHGENEGNPIKLPYRLLFSEEENPKECVEHYENSQRLPRPDVDDLVVPGAEYLLPRVGTEVIEHDGEDSSDWLEESEHNYNDSDHKVGLLGVLYGRVIAVSCGRDGDDPKSSQEEEDDSEGLEPDVDLEGPLDVTLDDEADNNHDTPQEHHSHVNGEGLFVQAHRSACRKYLWENISSILFFLLRS